MNALLFISMIFLLPAILIGGITLIGYTAIYIASKLEH